MYIPKHLQSNLNVDQLKKNLHKTVSNIDIAPTIIDVLGLRKNKQIVPLLENYSGFSLLKSIPKERAIITMNNNEVARFKVGISIVKNGWHYLHKMNNVPHSEELYFLKKDKKEKRNLIQWARRKQLRQILNELQIYPICSDYLPKKEE
jgi:arylsulfatase A-like enzyme